MSPRVIAKDLVAKKERELSCQFDEIDDVAKTNLTKILDAFRENKLTQEHFNPNTGYGLDDIGRETLDRVYAQVFGGESALVRVQMVCGTHAIACAILGNVQKDSKFVCLTGAPYDSLEPVIGVKSNRPGSLTQLGARYVELDLSPTDLSEEEVKSIIDKVGASEIYYLQKSCGYSSKRNTYSNSELGKLIRAAREVSPESLIMVDNCYGEFVETTEPLAHGADIIMGSLIKNPGAGLAIAGGYIVGSKESVQNAVIRLTAPGVEEHMGLNFNQGRLLFQGLFLAPSTVSYALKGVLLMSAVFEELGLNVKPNSKDKRFDIIQAIKFEQKEKLINFCKAMQRFSPVDSHVEPEPYRMPGYTDQVVMAGGTFIEGSTIELSCDGPIRPPYSAYLQGGLSYHHVKCYLEGALDLSMSGELPFF